MRIHSTKSSAPWIAASTPPIGTTTWGATNAVSSSAPSLTKTDPSFDVAKAHELYAILLGPFAREIKGKRLLIAGFPVGLPLAVLVTEKPSEALPNTAEGYRDINWLGSQHAITTLPSVASLRALRMLAKAERAPELFIGFGDPALGGNPSCGKPSLPASCPGTSGGIGQRVASLLGTTSNRSAHRAVTRAPPQS